MKYRYWFANLGGISSAQKERILKYCESAEEFYGITEKQMHMIYGMDDVHVEKVMQNKRNWELEREYEHFLEKETGFVTVEESAYPDRLRVIKNRPYALYYKGQLPGEERPAAAIVGARMCSDYGRAMAKSIGETLARSGVQIISGMARGIDSFGHAGALKAGKDTYAVLGCGTDICYPKSSVNLYQEIGKNGGIISEYPPGTEPLAHQFPQRNRIISGLGDVVIVVEARMKSGSLITADYALEQGKDVYAVPGRMTDALSGGTNRLIKQGAGIVVSMEELLKDLYLQTDKFIQKPENTKNSLEKEESLVYSELDLSPKSMDELIEATGLSISEISVILMRLQQKMLVEESFKNAYRRSFD